MLKKYERTRYLMFWHDGSCISKHGHIMTLSVRAWLSTKYSVYCGDVIHLFASQMPDGWSPVTIELGANKWHFRVKPEDWNWDHWCYANI